MRELYKCQEVVRCVVRRAIAILLLRDALRRAEKNEGQDAKHHKLFLEGVHERIPERVLASYVRGETHAFLYEQDQDDEHKNDQ